jgi:site-specific DNA-methyltransferase (adenine-specific)
MEFWANKFPEMKSFGKEPARIRRKKWGPVHDVNFFYQKRKFTWNPVFLHDQKIHQAVLPHSDEKARFVGDLTGAAEAGVRPRGQIQSYEYKVPNKIPGNFWRRIKRMMCDKNWRRWTQKDLIIGLPTPAGSIFQTLPRRQKALDYCRCHHGHKSAIGRSSQERLGYPTQKPQALLERIIEASSNKGDLVLDPFCGCGTTIHAAQKLGRQWIGIDVTYLAINLIKRRLKDAFGDDGQFEERGQPTDFGSAKALAELDKWQFQQWALSLIDARPRTQGDGKGADRGVDGMLYFYESKDKREKILVQVKGGGVKRNDVATLLGDVNNQKFVAGILLTLEKPTKPMREEAADAGRYTSKLWHDKDYPKIQILTIEGLLNGTERVEAPPQMNPFAKAQREAKPEKQQEML